MTFRILVCYQLGVYISQGYFRENVTLKAFVKKPVILDALLTKMRIINSVYIPKIHKEAESSEPRLTSKLYLGATSNLYSQPRGPDRRMIHWRC